MNILGKKVYLRALEQKDCDMLLKLINDPETERMIGGYSFPTSSLAQNDWLINKANGKNVFRCAIVPNDENDAVGTIILSDIDEKNACAEIHIKLLDTARGKGFGSDAVNAILKYAFNELRLNCIYSNVVSYNDASKELFEKCNFKQEGILRSRLFKDGNFQDVYSYSILKSEYEK